MQSNLLQLFMCIVCGHNVHQHINTTWPMTWDKAVYVIVFTCYTHVCAVYIVEGLELMLRPTCVLVPNELYKVLFWHRKYEHY